MARTLYEYKLNATNYFYTRWIPFNDFRNIEYLAKSSFGEVHKATWIGRYNEKETEEALLKRTYNSCNKIIDFLRGK